MALNLSALKRLFNKAEVSKAAEAFQEQQLKPPAEQKPQAEQMPKQETVVAEKFVETEIKPALKEDIKPIPLPKLYEKTTVVSEDILAKLRTVSETYPLITSKWHGSKYVVATANIKFNSVTNQLNYVVEEPPIDNRLKEMVQKTIELLQSRLEVDFAALKAKKEVYSFVDKKVNEIWEYLGVKLNAEEELKVKYYIFRDTIGLGKIEALMRDPNIEDISADGAGIPLFIFHRNPIYGEMPTNIVFNSKQELDSFVMRLAQKAGKTVSVATPLLDATLPDNSRLQATFGTDIARKGSNFSIRKFFKVPLTVVDLIDFGTTNPLIMAYLWFAVEEQQSILVSGGTATGKCVAPNCNVLLADNRIKTAENIFDEYAKEKSQGEIVTEPKKYLSVLTFNPETAEIEKAEVSKLWKLKAPGRLVKVLIGGSYTVTTPEHLFYIFNEGLLDKKRADQLSTEDTLVLPRTLPAAQTKLKIDLLEEFKESEDIFAFGVNKEVRTLISKLSARYKTRANLARHLGVTYKRLAEWCHKNAIPLKCLSRLTALADEKIEVKYIKAKKSAKVFKNINKITPELLEFVGYIIADGSLYRNNIRFTNTAEELLNRFLELGESLFGVKGEKTYTKMRAPFARIFGRPVVMILEKLFGIPVDCKKADVVRLSDMINKAPNDCIRALLCALFDSESSVSKKECHIELTTASKALIEHLPVLLLRFGITSNFREKIVNGKIYYRLNIFGRDNLLRYASEIGYRKEEKSAALNAILSKIIQLHTNIDLVRGIDGTLRKAVKALDLTYKSVAERSGLSEGTIKAYCQGLRAPKPMSLTKVANALSEFAVDSESEFSEVIEENLELLKKLANLEVIFLHPQKIEILDNKTFDFVYDFTVEKTHNFLAGNGVPFIISNTTFLNSVSQFIHPTMKIVSIEDTAELMLPQINWVPQIARSGYGPKKYGEVSMFDLLKAALRQRPDYIIVGEVRGEEANVMFQAMATGHPALSTIHASGMDAVIDRFTTRPISLPLALLEHLDIVIFLEKVKKAGKFTRRISQIIEVTGYDRDADRLKTSEVFKWLPVEDEFVAEDSYILARIAQRTGKKPAIIREEIMRRAAVLRWMDENGIHGFKDVASIINMYYVDPKRLAAMMEMKRIKTG